MNSFSMCNFHILKFISESSAYSYYWWTLQTAIMHEHSLFQCVTQIWYFSTGNNVTELMTAYRSGQVCSRS